MSESKIEILEQQLEQHLGEALPANAANNINAALELAGILENKGFSFKLKDLCPKSMTDTRWRAVFSKDGEEFASEDAQSPLAVCMAALGALARD